MCGLAGIFALRDAPRPSLDDVRPMLSPLVHRGPDSDGFHVAPRAALGFRRLAVIDLESGDQPIFDEGRGVAVFLNGEIYNFAELRAELEARGHPFRTRSDVEVVAHLYEEQPADFVTRLRGMFALAVYDRRAERLVLARDRLGKKPLYYAEVDGWLLYGSELKALLACPRFPRSLDLPALLDFFTYRAVPTPKTIFRAARKLPAGHLLVADAEGLRAPRPYWRLSFADPIREPPARLAERLAEQLDESVRLRLTADVPLGAFLSGGLDSTAVVASMVGAGTGPVRTFTVGFEDPRHDERGGAAATAAALGTEHVEASVTLDPTVDLDLLAWHFDEPFSDASAIPTYAVSRAARRLVTVALSGDGGDECFAGYRSYFAAWLTGTVRGVMPVAARPLLGALASIYPRPDWLPRPFRAKVLLEALATDPLRAHQAAIRATDPDLVRGLLADDLQASLHDYDPLSVLEDAYARTDAPDPLGRLLQLDLTTHLVDDILTKVDRASMAASLEVRCPLLDHRLVELAARIPSHYKLRFGRSKWILRRALARRAPRAVLRRPKHGFDVPLRRWTRGLLRPSIETAIEQLCPSIFSRSRLLSAWQAHLRGEANYSELFWAALMLDRWRQMHSVPLP